MFTSHFLKVLLIFTTLIAFGLLGVFLVSALNDNKSEDVESTHSIPKERILAE